MGELIVQLLPPALGIALSPLAIMALVAILLSRLARVNGLAFLIGWSIGVLGVFALALWALRSIELHETREPPTWAAVVRIVLGLSLVIAAAWVYRRGQRHVDRMASADSPRGVVAAAPQLPGWLQTVSTFRPGRSAVLGTGIFALNPVDLSCAVIGALDIVLARLPDAQTIAVGTGFVVIGILPIAIPVVIVLIAGERARRLLDRLRAWIARHTNVLNAALLLVIGALQLDKGATALL